jgi:uncharacterized protein
MMRLGPLHGLVLASAMVLGGVASAAAQTAPSADSLQVAGQVVQAMGINQVANAAMQGVRLVIVQSIAQRNKKPEDQVGAIVDQIVVPDLQVREPRFLASVATIYAQQFTLEELQQILAFYQTPAGQKLESLTPALTQQMIAAGRAWVQQAGAEVLQQDEAKLKAQGLSIQ